MKKTTLTVTAALMAIVLSTASLRAASGNWNVDADGNWSVATNWSSNPTVPGTVAGDVVGLNYPVTAARTVTLDTAATVGTLDIGSPASPFFAYTLVTNGVAPLTFNNNGSGASLNQLTAGGAADVIPGSLLLSDNLTVDNVNTLTLSGVIGSSLTVSLTKNGTGQLTLSGANTYTANNLFLNGGTLYVPRTAANDGTSGGFGNISGGGMNIYLGPGATLSSGNNNWFGNQTLADSSLPTINLTGGTLAITNNYTTIGALNLTNGATVTSTGTGGGNYYGFQLRGNVTVGGTTPSTLSGTRDYHLNANTVFDVENIGGSPADLMVSANLRNLSGDFGNAAGGLTKNGPGTMMMTGTANSYSGETLINAGTLQIGDGMSSNGSLTGYIDDEADLVFANPTAWAYSSYIVGAGSVTKTGAGTLTLSGTSYYTGSTVVSNGVLRFTSPQSISGPMTVNDGATLAVSAVQDATYLSPGSLTLGNSAGGALQFDLYGTGAAVLSPSSVTINGAATINISSCPLVNGAVYPLLNGYSSGTLVLGAQPAAISGQLVVNGSTVSYQVTNVVIETWTAAVNTNWDTVTANWTNSDGGNLFVSNYPAQFDDSANGAGPALVNVFPSAVTPGLLTVSNMARDYIIGGAAISGGGGLVKDGNGGLTLTGTNTFTGSMTISAGAVVLGDGGQLGGGNYPGTITDNGALSFASTAVQVLAGTISGTGSLTNAGPGTLTLAGTNTFSGGTVLEGGSTVLPNGSFSAFGTGALVMSNASLVVKPGNGSSYNSANSDYLGNSVSLPAGTTNVIDDSVNNYGNLWVGGDSSPWTGSGTVKFQNSGTVVSPAVLWCANPLQNFTGTINIGATGTGQRMYVGFGYNSGNGGAGSSLATLDFSGVAWQMGDVGYSWSQCVDGNCTTIKLGSLAAVNPSTYLRGGPNPLTYEVGALNTDTTYAGSINDWTATTLTKVGTGTLTLSGVNTFTGGLNINAGILSVSNSGAISASCPISFGGGELQYTPANQGDYSGQIGNSASPISIDVNGANVTFASALAANNTGGLALTNSTGVGVLTLTAGNLYTGSTFINAGTLALSGNGNVGASTNISVASGATYNVSAVSYTLGGSQTLSGNGTVTGTVTTAGIGSRITPGGSGVVGALTFANNLNLSAGGSPVFDLSTSHSSGNDQIVVGGNLTLNNSDAIHVNALSGSANLDTADYVLFSVAGATAMASQPALVFDGTAPANAGHYSIATSGNNVVLHYTLNIAPAVTSVIVTNNANGTSVASRGDYVTIYVTVSPGSGTITNVSANLTSIGGSASQTLTSLGGNNYSYTLQIGPGATAGLDIIGVTVTDTTPLTGGGSGSITINSSTDTWSGLGSDDNWSDATNWAGSVAPGYVGDPVIFTGNTRTTPNMNGNYTVASLTFNSSAGSFAIGSTTGSTLTLSGGVTNQSASAQALNVPMVLSTPQTIEDQLNGGITLGGPISGSAPTVDMGVVTLGGANTYSGNTTIAGGTLKVANNLAIPSGSGAGNVVISNTAIFDLNGTNATVNGVIGSSGSQILNNGASLSTLTIGTNNQSTTYPGTLADGSSALSLVKIGTGTLTLSSADNYSGGTTNSAGLMLAGNASSFGTGTIILNGGAVSVAGAALAIANPIYAASATTSTLGYAGANQNMTLSGAITGSGTLQNFTTAPTASSSVYFTGDGSQFTGTFLYTGPASGNGQNWRFGGVNGASGGTFDGSQANFVINGGNGKNLGFPDGSSSVVLNMGSLSGNGYFQGAYKGGSGCLLQVGFLNADTAFSGQIGLSGNNMDNFGLTKVGTGTLTLSGANVFTGPTVVSNGTLNVSSRKTSSGAFTVADNATLGVNLAASGAQLKMTSLTLGSSIGCTNTFTGISSQTVPAITNSGALTLAGTITVNAQGFYGTGQYPLINSAGGITGSGGFVIGTLPAGAAATIITNGNAIVLNVTTAPSVQIWTGSASGNWDKVTTNWTFSSAPVAYSDTYAAQFDDSASVTNVTLTTNVSPLTILINNNTHDYTFAASAGSRITGAASINQSGAGTLTLTGMSNDFTGGFNISGGTVVVSDSSNLGAGTVALNGTLSPAQGFTIARTINIGPGSGSGTGVFNVGAGIGLTNGTAMGNNASGTGTLVKTGAGILQLGGSSTYSGGTIVSNGTLVLTTGGGAGTIRGALTIDPGTAVSLTAQDALGYNSGQSATPVNIIGGTLDDAVAANNGFITTFNLTGGAITSSGGGLYNLNGSHAGLNSLAASTVSTVSAPLLLRSGGLTINTAQGTVPDGIDLVISGPISQSASGFGFTKAGAGTLELTGTNTYTGNTTVSAGSLLIGGNGVVASTVSVNSGAVLEGTGTINGATTVNAGGTLAPGNAAIGILTFGNNLTLSGNTVIKLNKGLAQSNDIVNVTGTLTYGGTLTLSNTGPALVAGDSFRIFKSGGANTNALTISGNAGSGLAFSFFDGVVTVVNAGPTGPASITNSVSGNTLSLSWPAGQNWKLQMQTNGLSSGLGTNWVYVTDGTVSSTNITIDPTQPTAFYRLVYP